MYHLTLHNADVFEEAFGEICPDMLSEYCVPSGFFDDDVLGLLGVH